MTEPDLSFQHYKVLRRADGSLWELGRGSMGITYKAFDVNLCCEVALKVINAATLEHPHARDRFVSEARAAAKLRHRNIASVYHLGNDGEHYFYAMEFVDGETLDTLVRQSGPLPVATVLRILLQASRALAAASRQGLVHRDLKPANVMVTHEDDDEDLLVKVIDFGLAKPIASTDGTRPLTFGGFVGTPQFASPEQLEERRVDGRSDIYSLGATAWFLLTGRAPFLGPLATICRQHLTQPPPWSQLPKPFPETVRTLLAHMLEKDPARRPADAVDLRRQIEAALEVIREPSSSLVPVYRKYVAKPVNWSRNRVAPPPGGAPAEGEAPRTGMILKGRYELLRLVGEGNSGRVFSARDRASGEALVAIKVLHPELVGASAERERLGDEVRLIQTAAHPHLIQIAAMESLPSQETAFLVEEWLHGFTLLDFLAVRGGALPLGEGLRLVEQAATASDHAVSRGLERLDFALHQFHLHFPVAGGAADDADGARQPMQTAMSQWPAWSLKLNPLGALRNGLESSTWAGDVTLVPGGANLKQDTASGKPKTALRDLYTRGVAQLTYELLGGAPASPVYGDNRRAKYASLPALNEEANAILQRALLQGAAFASGSAFYEAIARAAGLDPGNLPLTGGLAPSARQIPVALSSRKITPEPPLPPSSDIRSPNVEPESDVADAPTLVARKGLVAGSTVVRPAATFDGDGEPLRDDSDPWVAEDENASGNVWDRLALVSGEGGASRLWIGGVIAAFLLLAGGSIAFLRAHVHPRKHAPSAVSTQAAKPPRSHSPARSTPAASPSPALALATPAKISETPVPTTPAKPALALVRPDTVIPNVTPDTVGTPPPLASELHDASVRVRVDSQPAGAQILCKGKVLGVTPLDTTLPAGDYQLVARYKNWPEIHQALHVEDGQDSATTVLRLMPPALVPSTAIVVTPITRARRAQEDAVVRRNFVRSTRGSSPSPAPSPDVSATPAPGDTRRTPPTLHPFDPEGVFRQNGRTRDDS